MKNSTTTLKQELKGSLTLHKAIAYDEQKNSVGYRYTLVIPASFTGSGQEESEVIYESYLYENPLDDAIHNEKAKQYYETYVKDFIEKANYKGFSIKAL